MDIVTVVVMDVVTVVVMDAVALDVMDVIAVMVKYGLLVRAASVICYTTKE